jgi:large subunit ribosomal protein L4
MELEIYRTTGEKANRTATLNDSIYGIEPNDHAIYLDVKQYMANNRQGTHSALEKSQISGSTKKLKRQKGTGGARAGSIKSPLLKGGARVFGPRPKDYYFKLNKKVKKLARNSALSYKVKENNLLIIEDINFETYKTKQSLALLKNFDLLNKKTLIVLGESNKNVILSTRNLGGVRVVTVSDLITYDILNANKIVLSEGSIGKINEVFSI